MFYDNFSGILRVLVVGPLGYLWLIAVLRVTGKRTLAQLNAFDFIVTVALGSTLASVVLTKSVAWLEGAVALALLAALQLAAAWLAVRSSLVRRGLTSRPTLLVKDGVVLHAALERQRLTEQGLRQAVRASGVGGMDLIAAVVLETNGTVSVITLDQAGSRDTLSEVS
ncbi:MAG: YetF domain-containing protein [Nakamurella sp.]